MEIYGIKKWLLELFFAVCVIAIWIIILSAMNYDIKTHMPSFVEMIGK